MDCIYAILKHALVSIIMKTELQLPENPMMVKQFPDYTLISTLIKVLHFSLHSTEDFIESSYNTMDFSRTRSSCSSVQGIILGKPCHSIV